RSRRVAGDFRAHGREKATQVGAEGGSADNGHESNHSNHEAVFGHRGALFPDEELLRSNNEPDHERFSSLTVVSTETKYAKSLPISRHSHRARLDCRDHRLATRGNKHRSCRST